MTIDYEQEIKYAMARLREIVEQGDLSHEFLFKLSDDIYSLMIDVVDPAWEAAKAEAP